jgi:error-prone DNA polymerase
MSTQSDYVELHARSAFSFLEGASQPEELIEACAGWGQPSIALLDRDGVYGAPRFHLAARKRGVRAHIGAEVTGAYGAIPANGTFRYPLLVKSRTGYQNLCRLITRMKLSAPKNASPEVYAVARDDVRPYTEGLICLTGGDEGPLSTALARDGLSGGEQCLRDLIDLFGRENVYVELQRHFRPHEEARNHAAVELARCWGLPVAATGGVCYATAAAREIMDVFTCLRHHRTLETAGRLLEQNSERYLKSSAEMTKLFADLPEALAHALEIASRLEFTLEDLGYQFPIYPVPEGMTQASFLRARTYEGMIARYGCGNARAERQVERELGLIEKLQLEGYFLIVWDIVRECRARGILVQGRGSAANSAVCYSLGITAVDPVGMDLLFERFLSEERGEWPDIDLDLPSGDDREQAIQYVYERYGKLGAAMTANVITYRGRSAAREVGKVLGFDAPTLDRVARLINAWEISDSHETLQQNFREGGCDLNHPRMRKFFNLCQAIQDLPRHLGQHSGGMVVCQGQLDAVVPLENATMPGRVVIQWDKEDCADMGIVKVDLLGLGMMAVLKDSIRLIWQHHGEQVDLAKLPQNDPLVYDTLCKADTVGIFQVESRAQMSCLPRLRPRCFYDLVVQVAIIRPGPIVGQMVNPYLKRRQGREAVDYLHPSLQPALERTLGVPLFQEQLLRIAMIAAGFSGGEAEELRRAFGFKRSEKRMRDVEIKLRRGMDRKGIAGTVQDRIVQSITSFALYGFPESHAASFALIAYASAWLKCHYLAAFTAAMLNNQPMGFYAPATLIKDAQLHGLKFRPIDVLRSEWDCTLEPLDVGGAGDTNVKIPAREGERNHLAHGAAVGARRDPGVLQESPGGGSVGSEGGEEKTSLMPPLPGLGNFSADAFTHGCRRGLNDVTRFAGFDEDRHPLTSGPFAVRLGLRYAKGLRESMARDIVRARARGRFTSVEDLKRRVPEIAKSELVLLAEIGALNRLESRGNGHRRSALWIVERAARPAGPLLEDKEAAKVVGAADARSEPPRLAPEADMPLAAMNPQERLLADFRGTGLTIGPHPMRFYRAEMNALGVTPAGLLHRLPHGRHVRVAGGVIARQRPGTAKGFVFLSLEDETGICNIIVSPDLFDRQRVDVVTQQFLIIHGTLQTLDGVISIKAQQVRPLAALSAPSPSHDFR